MERNIKRIGASIQLFKAHPKVNFVVFLIVEILTFGRGNALPYAKLIHGILSRVKTCYNASFHNSCMQGLEWLDECVEFCQNRTSAVKPTNKHFTLPLCDDKCNLMRLESDEAPMLPKHTSQVFVTKKRLQRRKQRLTIAQFVGLCGALSP
jgi:hypothetical protein